MKKQFGKISIAVLLSVVIVLLFANLFILPLNATTVGRQNIATAVAAVQTDVDALLILNSDGLAASGAGGSVWYVDSGATGTGTAADWTNADITIELALVHCTASAGDIIYVAPGHAESFTGEDLDIDKIGVQIIGLGTGSLKPTITYTHANGEVAIGAASVSIKNIRFFASVTDVLMGIEVETGIDYFTIEDCEFVVDSDGTDEFAEAINFVSANENCTIKNCIFNAKAGGAVAAIMLDDTVDCLSITGNEIRGDYSSACIFSDGAATDLLICNNFLINGALVADGGANAEPTIELANNSAGFIADNRMVSDVATGILMHVADDCTFMNNFITDDDGDEFDGQVASSAASIAGHTDGD